MTNYRGLRLLFGLVLLPSVGCQSVHTPGDGKRWGTAAPVETLDIGLAWRPQVAMDADGSALAVWDESSERNNISDDVWANWSSPRGEWGSPKLLEEHEPDDSIAAQVAIDGDGNAIVVWQQDDGARADIWSTRYVSSTDEWTDPELLETDDRGTAQAPQVAIRLAGEAVTVWQQSDGMRETIWSARYAPGADEWSDPERVESNDAGGAEAPQIAMDANGNSVAVWQQFNGRRVIIFSSRATLNGVWGEPRPIDHDDQGDAKAPQVAMDADGNAIAVWQQQSDGARSVVWFNHSTANGVWDEPQPIDDEGGGDAEKPQVAMSPGGDAVAVWVQLDRAQNSIWSNHYTQGAGWVVADTIETDETGFATFPQVAIDRNGDAVAVWVQFDGVQESIWSNRYLRSYGWGRHQAIEKEDSGEARLPQVAMDPNGNAVAVWVQGSEGLAQPNIWSNRLQEPVPDAVEPTN